MKKILIATMALALGGAETHIVELSRELCRRGYDVTVISAGGVYEEDIRAAGAKHVYAPLNSTNPHSMAVALGALTAIMRVENFDIVHAHARIPAFLCGLLQKRYKFRFVTTAHSDFVARGIKKMLSNWGERTIAVSEDLKQYLLDNYKDVSAENISLTINGIDTDRFSPGASGKHIKHEFGIPDSAPVVVTVSRLDNSGSFAPARAVEALIDSTPALLQSIPNLRVIVVGSGDAELELTARASKINAEFGYNAIIMTGARLDVDAILAAGDLFVGVSRAALEAMATATPVILSGGQGYMGLFTGDKLDECIATNFTARGLEPATAEALVRDITEFFADRGSLAYETRVTKLGAECRSIITRLYSVAHMVDDCIAVYESLGLPLRRVAISGYFGYGNVGDEAIMQSVHDSIIAERPGTEITVLSRKPSETREKYGVKASARFNPFAMVRTLSRSDALVFGGGSLLQDGTSTRSLLYYLSVIRTARFFRKPVMIYANGIGPITKPANIARVRRAIESATAVTLRDERSLDELRSMGVVREDIIVTGDPVYTMELPSESDRAAMLCGLGIDAERPFITICARPVKDAPKLADEIARFCELIHEQLGFDTVFMPMQTSRDTEFSRAIAAKMTSPAIVLDRELVPREVLAVLAETRFVLSLRLHSLIFAARAATPSMAIDIDPKIRAALETLGLPNLGEPQNFRAEDALFKALDLDGQHDELSANLQKLADEQAELAKKDPQILASLLG